MTEHHPLVAALARLETWGQRCHRLGEDPHSSQADLDYLEDRASLLEDLVERAQAVTRLGGAGRG